MIDSKAPKVLNFQIIKTENNNPIAFPIMLMYITFLYLPKPLITASKKTVTAYQGKASAKILKMFS